MAPRTTIHLMRHGEVHNPDGVLYGRLPGFHLSDLGRHMAEIVADELAHRDVVVLVSSPLERAQETAAPIAARHGLPITTDERVIEATNFFEGRTFGHGDGALWRVKNLRLLRDPRRPSWGEPFDELADRMLAAVEDARDLARGHEAVIVSHQAPIWTLRRRLEGKRLWHDPRNRQCGLASLTSVTYSGDDLMRLTYSEPAGAIAAQGKGVGA
jgi:broad specificity phosphatase PhoE